MKIISTYKKEIKYVFKGVQFLFSQIQIVVYIIAFYNAFDYFRHVLF